jgi:hypothetical protein
MNPRFVAKKLLTVVTESALERDVVAAFREAGARGCTLIDSRGEGPRGGAGWEQNRQVRIAAPLPETAARALALALVDRYAAHFALTVFLADVEECV